MYIVEPVLEDMQILKPFRSNNTYNIEYQFSWGQEISGADQMMDELERALSGASTADKTVILAVINKAYVEGDKAMLDLFLDGFWLGEETQGLLDHLLLVAVDQTSFDRCKFLHLHCYKLETEGIDFRGEKLYMSQDFINMMWRRTLFLSQVLEKGYNFIFTVRNRLSKLIYLAYLLLH